jgi:hypothetical protein
MEKVPLVVLALGAAALTLYGHYRIGGLVSVERITVGARLANAVVRYTWS